MIDTTVPSSARMWNYYLGGKDNYQVDRDAAEEILAAYPDFGLKARACRHFLFRTVKYLVVEAGVRQFIDIGPGLPNAENTHEVAQRCAPQSRVVYVDNDPLVLAHARSLLTSSAQGVTRYVHADVRDPDTIVAEAREVLDLRRPTALLLFGVLGHVGGHDEACSIVRRLVAALAPGSYLAHCDGTTTDDAYVQVMDDTKDNGCQRYVPRSPKQIAAFYEGLELVEPGVVPIHLWRPEPADVGAPTDIDESGGVGRKR